MQTRTYVQDWVSEATLRDGTSVELRLVRPEDKPLFILGFSELSSESRYRRFMVPKESLSDTELAYFTEVDHENHVAIGVVRIDEIMRAHPVGIGRFIRDKRHPDIAEAAIAVVDSMQHKGVGKLILQHLVLAALERNITRFRAEILADNEPMKQLLSELHVPHTEEQSGDVLLCEFALTNEREKTDTMHDLFRLVAKGILIVKKAL